MFPLVLVFHHSARAPRWSAPFNFLSWFVIGYRDPVFVFAGALGFASFVALARLLRLLLKSWCSNWLNFLVPGVASDLFPVPI